MRTLSYLVMLALIVPMSGEARGGKKPPPGAAEPRGGPRDTKTNVAKADRPADKRDGASNNGEGAPPSKGGADSAAGAKSNSKSKAAATRRPARTDLDQVPTRAAKALEAKAASSRKQARPVMVRLLKKIRAVGQWNISPTSPGQVKGALRKLNTYRKQLDGVDKLHSSAFAYDASALRLRIKAAQIRELVDGTKTDLSKVKTRLAVLAGGKPQALQKARIKGLGLLIDALEQYIKGDLAEAIIRTTKAIKTDDQLALAFVYQGSFYYLTKNKQKAVSAWERALKLNPKDREIQQALRAVK